IMAEPVVLVLSFCCCVLSLHCSKMFSYNSSHSQKPSSTLRPGDVNRVAHTSVSQPASVTHIQSSLPGQVQFSGGGKPGAEFGTLISCFIERKLLDANTECAIQFCG
uniref:Uncharacterized protein n=1 Tax=Seriola lalandi dorsalis TaxID=1841481 RepID=A0A3B4WQ68_SERLL